MRQVVVRLVVRMALPAECRIVERAPTAHFLTDLRKALEAPTSLLL